MRVLVSHSADYIFTFDGLYLYLWRTILVLVADYKFHLRRIIMLLEADLLFHMRRIKTLLDVDLFLT